jgi:hypothetical protein
VRTAGLAGHTLRPLPGWLSSTVRPAKGSQEWDDSVLQVSFSEIRDDVALSLRAETQEIVITRQGEPAGVLIGFESEEDWVDYRLVGSNRRRRTCAKAAG